MLGNFVFLRQFVTYILLSHEKTLLAAKQQSSCVYVYIYLYMHIYIYMQMHRVFIQGQESSSDWFSTESNSIN